MATLAFQRGIAGGELGEGAAIAVSMIPFLVFADAVQLFRPRAAANGSREKPMTDAALATPEPAAPERPEHHVLGFAARGGW